MSPLGMPMKSLTYPTMLLSAWVATDSSQTLHGLLAFAGIGVLVISACMGESARKAMTKLMIRTSLPSIQSWATYPFVARSLGGKIKKQKCYVNMNTIKHVDIAMRNLLYLFHNWLRQLQTRCHIGGGQKMAIVFLIGHLRRKTCQSAKE